MAKIIEIDKLKIEVGIPESDVAAVRKLETFDITIDALGSRTYTGYSHYLYKTSDSFARLYNLEIRLDNPDQQILPDMFVRVGIIKKQDQCPCPWPDHYSNRLVFISVAAPGK